MIGAVRYCPRMGLLDRFLGSPQRRFAQLALRVARRTPGVERADYQPEEFAIAIHRAGGPGILEECRAIVARQGGCKTGEAVITSGGETGSNSAAIIATGAVIAPIRPAASNRAMPCRAVAQAARSARRT